MSQVDVVVQHRNDLPGGLPAIWIKDRCGEGRCVVNLYLRSDMPQSLADMFRVMAVRDALPGVEFDFYTISDANTMTPVVSPLQFAGS